MANFDEAFKALIGNEGGYVNNPKDPGGETMYGVTARVARAHGYTGSMIDLPLETAKNIAKAQYWTPYHCDSFADVVAFQVLDAAYNGGYPVKWLQLSAGITPDGKIGQQTIDAVNAINPYQIVLRFLSYRLSYFTACKPWPTFGRGWANRIATNMLRGAK
jgi:lysozyme family protein